MEYRTLGRTGVEVSTHCLGAMMFGPWGNTDQIECVRMIHQALDAGVNFVDTADVYGEGRSEEIVGQALEGRRDDVFLATKGHGRMGTGINDEGNSRLWIMREVENSLRRLRTDHIDLYQIHRPEPETDIEETLSSHRPGPPGQGALPGVLDVPRSPDRRGSPGPRRSRAP